MSRPKGQLFEVYTSTSGDNAIEAAPGENYEWVVSGVELMCDEAQVMKITKGAGGTTAFGRFGRTGGGFGVDLYGEWALGRNNALVLNLSTETLVSGHVYAFKRYLGAA